MLSPIYILDPGLVQKKQVYCSITRYGAVTVFPCYNSNPFLDIVHEVVILISVQHHSRVTYSLIFFENF